MPFPERGWPGHSGAPCGKGRDRRSLTQDFAGRRDRTGPRASRPVVRHFDQEASTSPRASGDRLYPLIIPVVSPIIARRAPGRTATADRRCRQGRGPSVLPLPRGAVRVWISMTCIQHAKSSTCPMGWVPDCDMEVVCFTQVMPSLTSACVLSIAGAVQGTAADSPLSHVTAGCKTYSGE